MPVTCQRLEKPTSPLIGTPMSQESQIPDPLLLSQSLFQKWERWRSEREAALQAPYGWLSLTGIHWVSASEHTKIPGIPGHWTEENGQVNYHPDPTQAIPTNQKGAVVTTVVRHWPYESDAATLLYFGGIEVELINRDGKFALRTRDPQAASRQQFSGITTYPFAPEWIVPASFERLPQPVSTGVPTILPGVVQQKRVIGTITFTLQGTDHQLAVLETNGVGPSILFRDLTSGTSTYGAGRFIYLFSNELEGLTSIDFNRAINPPCYFSPFCTCPVALSKLDLEVTAGERVSLPEF